MFGASTDDRYAAVLVRKVCQRRLEKRIVANLSCPSPPNQLPKSMRTSISNRPLWSWTTLLWPVPMCKSECDL